MVALGIKATEMVSCLLRIAFLTLLMGTAVGLAACDGGEETGTPSPAPTGTSVAAATVPAEGRPSVSPPAGTTAGPGTTGQSEGDRALAAAEAIFDGTAGPTCTPTAESPTCITPKPSLASPERGIAAFGVGDGGAAIVFLGKTPEGEWKLWFGTQNVTYQLTVLPGDMRVCAGGAGLNVRASPAADSESLGLLAENTIVTVDRFVLTEPGSTSPTGQIVGYGWYHLTGPSEGWAYSKYVSDASLGDCSVHDGQVND